jgi:uncharacterized lipoprotein YehR (DUF1307 family)
MKNTLLSLLILFSLSGCQDKKEDQAQHDAKIAQEARAQLLKEQEEAKKKHEALEKNSKFSHIGVTSKDGKITIDTNKTKSYFKDLAHQMKTKMDKMSKDLEKGIVKNEEAGIEMDETHINIDLNKTKTFLDTWGKKMQGFVKEFDDIAKEFNPQNQTTKDTNAAN